MPKNSNMYRRLDEYFKQHLGKTIWITAGMLLAVNVILWFLLTNLKFHWLEILIYIMMPVVLLQIFAFVIVLRFALEPLEMITRAITHVSGEPTAVIPPQINEPYYIKTGLKKMIQTIYDRSAATTAAKDAAEKPPPNPLLLDRLPCGVIALNARGDVVYNNDKAPVTTNEKGYKVVELIPENNFSLANWLSISIQNKVSDTQIWRQIQNKLPGQNDRKIYDVIAYYEKNSRDGVDVLIITIDQTKEYSSNEEAIDFISLAAHELRGPITVIRGYLDVLIDELKPVIQPDQRQLIERLDVSASRLSGYINNILNVAKYDRQHLKLNLCEDNFRNIYATVADDLQLRASTQNRLLAISIPPDLPTVAADRNSISEVIANLVDNAIKYSSEGGQIIVSVKADEQFVVCSVQDFGIGIPTSVINNLFSKFYRSHRSRSSVSGTGLGLYISKGIIESHGGYMGVTSHEGKGSTFSFAIPIYSTVAEKLANSNNSNGDIIKTSSGWIRNHNRIGG
ncbi:MAG: HAMP domain-containing sensor histidine kinase [Candidatus Saccharimonadales bacterium]